MPTLILIAAAAIVVIVALPEIRSRALARGSDDSARRQPAGVLGALVGARQAASDAVLGAWHRATVSWQLPPRAAPYAELIVAAEARYALPAGLLGRTLYQESRFRPEIVAGAVASDAGAIGIAQFVPETAADRKSTRLN